VFALIEFELIEFKVIPLFNATPYRKSAGPVKPETTFIFVPPVIMVAPEVVAVIPPPINEKF
jgi:hypothetical protein